MAMSDVVRTHGTETAALSEYDSAEAATLEAVEVVGVLLVVMVLVLLLLLLVVVGIPLRL